MSDGLRDLAGEVCRYLEQQHEAGFATIWQEPLSEADRAELAAVALDQPTRVAVAPGAPAHQASSPTVQAPAPASASTPAPPPPPPQPPPPVDAKKLREQQFQAECSRFVADALALIDRTRAGQPARPAAEPADPVAALAAIADEARACTRCPLHAGRTQAVPGTGNPRAGLVLIGEAPGQEEDRQGLPFVGRSGQLLTDILKAIGFGRDEVFIGNVLKCRPPNNRDPQREEAEACAPFLSRQLAALRPRLILCLGRIAAQRLLGTDASLTSLRGTVHFYDSIPLMATFHPAALLRNPAQKRDAWDDVRMARALYDALGQRSGA